MPKKNPAAVALGKLGGLKSTPKKRAAARKNAKKGGRPKGVLWAIRELFPSPDTYSVSNSRDNFWDVKVDGVDFVFHRAEKSFEVERCLDKRRVSLPFKK